MTGYDTAGRIQDTYASAHAEFGRAPNFWIRYFTPSPAADLFNDDAVRESQGAWDSGGPYVGCISAPTQSRLSGSAAEGHADAQAFAAAMLSAYHSVGPLNLPHNNRLYCWLDQEYSTSLSANYWNAWAGYIADYNFADLALIRCTPACTATRMRPIPTARPLPGRMVSRSPAPSGRTRVSRAAAFPARPAGTRRNARRCGRRSGSSVSRPCAATRRMSTLIWAPPGFNTADYCFRLVRYP